MKRIILAGNKRLEIIASTSSAFCWLRFINDEGNPCHFAPDRRGLRRLIEALQEAETKLPATASDITCSQDAIT